MNYVFLCAYIWLLYVEAYSLQKKKKFLCKFRFLSRQNDDNGVVNGKNVYFIWLFHDRNVR